MLVDAVAAAAKATKEKQPQLLCVSAPADSVGKVCPSEAEATNLAVAGGCAVIAGPQEAEQAMWLYTWIYHEQIMFSIFVHKYNLERSRKPRTLLCIRSPSRQRARKASPSELPLLPREALLAKLPKRVDVVKKERRQHKVGIMS